jgi:dTDP-glucose 4,6-dehydratase
MAHRRVRGTNTGIVRIFNTYGPRLQPGDDRVVSSFVAQALAGEPLTVFGDGTQTRSFCFVNDLVRGLVLMLDSDEPGPINLGNPIELTIRQLADVVLHLTGSASEVVNDDLPVDDPACRCPDISRAQHLLGWTPVTSLEEGLRKTINWQRAVAMSGEP